MRVCERIYVLLTGLTYLDRRGFKECRNSLLCWLENRERGIGVSTKALALEVRWRIFKTIQLRPSWGVARGTYVPSLNSTEALLKGGAGGGMGRDTYVSSLNFKYGRLAF